MEQSQQRQNYWQQGLKFIAVSGILPMILLFQNCSPQQNSSSTYGAVDLASQSTTDHSGTWTLVRLDCYDSAVTKVTKTAVFNNGYSENLVISGSTLRKNISQGSCTVAYGGGIDFQSYYVTLSNLVVSAATNGTCIINTSLSNSGILPTNAATTYSTNEKILPVSQNFYFLLNENTTPKQLAILADFSDAAQEYCFKIYQK